MHACAQILKKKISMYQDKLELGYLGMRLLNAELCFLSNTYLYWLNFYFKNTSDNGEGAGTYLELSGSGLVGGSYFSH